MTSPVGLCQEDLEPYRHEEPQALPIVACSRTETAARVLLRWHCHVKLPGW